MEAENNETIEDNQNITKYGLSWIVYVRDAISAIIFVAIILAIVYYFFEKYLFYAGIVVAVFIILRFTLGFLSLRAIYLFTNERGVWVHSGIFPWTKGYNGVFWNDCGGASYRQSFFSYILRAYDVNISHKYTESQQIKAYNVHKGHQFVAEVNEYLHKIHKENRA